MMLGQSKMDITRVSLSLAILLCVASVVNAQDEASLAKSSAFYTTNFGQPIFTTSHSLTVGQRGESRALTPTERHASDTCEADLHASLMLALEAASISTIEACPALCVCPSSRWGGLA